MPTLDITAHKSSAFLERISDGLRTGAGQDVHIPVTPNWTGYRERGAIGFSVPPATWDPMGDVSKVELILTTTGSGGVHLGVGGSPSCWARRASEQWSPNGDTMDGGGSSTTSGLTYPGPASVSTDQKLITYSGSAGSGAVTTAITQLARAWMPTRLGGKGASCYGVVLHQDSSSDDAAEFYGAPASSGNRPILRITYTTLASAAPRSPSLVAPKGTNVPATTFSFTSADTLTAYDLQVSTDPTFATVSHWLVTSSAAGLTGGKSVSTAYAGTALTPGSVTYWWRARGRNANGVGAWCAAASFVVNTTASTGDQLDAWARTILSAMAQPRHHTILGTLIPSDLEVQLVASTDYGGRWWIRDANHGAPIDGIAELVGQTLRADGTAGWSVDATTHDLYISTRQMPSTDYGDRVLSGSICPQPTTHFRLGEASGNYMNSSSDTWQGVPTGTAPTTTRGAPGIAGNDGAVASSAGGGMTLGNLWNNPSAFTVAAWVTWNGANTPDVLTKFSQLAGVFVGWRMYIDGSGIVRVAIYAADNTQQFVNGGAIASGSTHHLIFTWDTSIRVYVDGVKGTDVIRTKSPGVDAAGVTRMNVYGTEDELSVWPATSFTDDMAAALYSGGTDLVGVIPARTPRPKGE